MGQKCSDIKIEGSDLEVAAGHALIFCPCPCPVGFGWKGGTILWWCVVISWAAKSPNNSLVSPILNTAPVPSCAPSGAIMSHTTAGCPESVLCPRDEDMRLRQCLGLWRSYRNSMFVSQSPWLLGLFTNEAARPAWSLP